METIKLQIAGNKTMFESVEALQTVINELEITAEKKTREAKDWYENWKKTFSELQDARRTMRALVDVAIQSTKHHTDKIVD